ncbi:hypothetical protein N865_04860 [Intrasporangium oryzae NRRL B-24470]|uniref:Lipoprotein n=1 Tax=Intrasporangium oryzae NRRL B-24470 TaxID=1386089 RepID=W9GB15_9MICO|nr:copper chaperone PCu(A)C [Intrasporangium oryzae]EWT02427.1 hypothetical protein N865_04860 [Intrasporangium oryzae NRRL B-24470]
MRPKSLAALAAAASLVLAGSACSQSNEAVDARIANPLRGNSVNAMVGDIRLLATRVEAPSDSVHLTNGNVGLFTTFANDGNAPDRLVAVSTVYARQVVLRDGLGGPDAPISVPVPARGVASLQYPGGLHLELVDLKFDVRGGSFLPVSFRFEKAGSITVNVFVEGFSLATVSPVTPSSS